MRRAGAFAHRHQRADRGVVAAEAVRAHGLGMIDVRHHVVLRHARLHLGDRGIHRGGADAPGLAHQSQFLRRLDQPRPVHQVAVVGEFGVRQALHQMRMTARGVVVRIHLDADARLVPAARLDQLHQLVIGVLDLVLHQAFRERHDVVGRQIGGDVRALGVLGAAEPDRPFLFDMHQHALRHVERPAAEPGQPAHVGGVLADDQVEARPPACASWYRPRAWHIRPCRRACRRWPCVVLLQAWMMVPLPALRAAANA